MRNWTPREAVVAKEASANREQQGGVGGASQNRVGVASQEGEGQEEEEDVLPTKSFTTVKLKVPTADELVRESKGFGGEGKHRTFPFILCALLLLLLFVLLHNQTHFKCRTSLLLQTLPAGTATAEQERGKVFSQMFFLFA